MDLINKRVLVTGGRGFLGSHLLEKLRSIGCKNVSSPSKNEFDLTDYGSIERLISTLKPQLVIHLAGIIGGIGANTESPGEFFYKNAKMGIELIEKSRSHGVEKFVQIGTACSYPENTPVPFKESDLWNGYPTRDTAPYGLAKKMLLVQLQAYKEQYGFNGIYLIPTNLYGPGDNFNLKTGHVIPSLIRKFVEAKELQKNSVEVWGSPSVTRDFLYVEEAATAIIKATEVYDSSVPLNIGSGKETSIAELVEIVKEEVRYSGDIVWNSEKPSGQPRRVLDISAAVEAIDFEPKIHLEEGIKRTIDWYRSKETNS